MVTDNEQVMEVEQANGNTLSGSIQAEQTRNTLLIRSVPTAATEEEIKAHFTEAYPTCEVTAVTLGFDVTKLSNLDEERIEAEENLLQKMREQLEKEPPTPLGMAFVTFKTNAMATLVRKDINALKCNKSIFCCGRRPKSSSKSEDLKVKKWRSEIASLARSIHWKNLPVKGFKWMGRFLLVNLAVLAGVTLLTTPAMMVNPFHMFTGTAPITDILSPIVRQFGPSLLLWKFSTLLSAIVYYSTNFESHWSRSSEQLSTMRKLYFFLILLVLILPSLGLTRCLFMPDQGVFAVNYVITAAFMGSMMDLLLFSQLLRYIFRWVMPRSAAVGKYLKQNQANKFEYGPMYSWTLFTFTVVMANSLICPIIAPFGLLWMLLRYFVNKYNLYFVYCPDPIDIRVHMEAIDMLMAAPITCLLWLYLTFLFTAGFWSAIALSTMLLALITFLACNLHKFFGCLKYIRPKKYKVTEEAAEKDTEVYLPRVLTMMRETIGTGPVAECMSTDSVVVMRHETCEAADNGPVAESCTGPV
ncbi:CSC1-like protein 1 [Platichthys flesus]|uniref:CSC1-like protein 1 n=1 Tax=Platichthys flesus TaxID=8260 RepID=UPI002DBB07B3|nr:CSC1-like protein 1 [Platichthys flesus]